MTMSQHTVGEQLQRSIDARAQVGAPVCPNGCGLPYHPVLGHMGPGYVVTAEDDACRRLLTAERDGERAAARESARLVELGQQRRHLTLFWCSLLVLAVLVALMVASSDGTTVTSSASVEVGP